MALGRPPLTRPSALRDPLVNVIQSSPAGLAGIHHAHYSAMGVPRPPTSFADPSKPWLSPSLYSTTSSAIRALGPAASLCRPIDMDTLHTLIRSLNSTAGGNDGVQNDILKSLLWPSSSPSAQPGPNAESDKHLLFHAMRGRQLLLRLILALINTILESASVPDTLLRGEIVSLYKGTGDPTLLSSYRPITLLSALYKLVTALLNQRLTTISNHVGGILSDAQCGSRPGQSSDTAATTLHLICKHAERNNAPIHLLATDISKAYDTAPYDGFRDAFTALGFDACSLSLLDALQSRFTCVARTFAGLSDAFQIDTGCKQGCGLSPFRFNVFLDMFIRYVDSLGLGYSIHIAHIPRGTSDSDTRRIHAAHPSRSGDRPCITIGVDGFFDDLTLLADSNPILQALARHLEVFLGTYGMTLNAGKCHYTYWEPPVPTPINISHSASGPASPVAPNPPLLTIILHDAEGHPHTVPFIPAHQACRYLGFHFPLRPLSSASSWDTQFKVSMNEVSAVATSIRYSKADPSGAVLLTNSLAVSKLRYVLGLATFTPSQLSSFHSLLCSSIIDSGHRLARVISYDALTQPAERGGLGLIDITSLAASLKCTFLQRCLSSPSFPCRMLTLLAISDANSDLALRQNPHQGRPLLVFGPPNQPALSLRQVNSLIAHGHPAFIIEGANRIRDAGWSIQPNPVFAPYSSLHPVEFLRPHIPPRSLATLRPFLPASLAAFLPPSLSHICDPHELHPTLCGRHLADICLFPPQVFQCDPSRLDTASSFILPILSRHLQSLVPSQPIPAAALSALARAFYPALASLVDSIRPLAHWHSDLSATPTAVGPSEHLFPSFPWLPRALTTLATSSTPQHIDPITLGTDGSAGLVDSSQCASFAVVSPYDTIIASPIPGHPTINRAELLGIYTALSLAPSDSPLTLVTDSRTSVDSIQHFLSSEPIFLHRLHFENDSLVRACARAISARSGPTSLVWVASHTDDSDSASKLNAAADAAARSALGPFSLFSIQPATLEIPLNPLAPFLASARDQAAPPVGRLPVPTPGPFTACSEALDTMPPFFFLDSSLSFCEGTRPSDALYSLFLANRLRSHFSRPGPTADSVPQALKPPRSLLHMGRLLNPPAIISPPHGLGPVWFDASTRAFVPNRLPRTVARFTFDVLTSGLHTQAFYHKLHTKLGHPSLFPTPCCALCWGDNPAPAGAPLIALPTPVTAPPPPARAPVYARAEVPLDTPCCVCSDPSIRGPNNPFFYCDFPDSAGLPCNKGFHHLCHPHSLGPPTSIPPAATGPGNRPRRGRQPVPPPPGGTDLVYCPDHYRVAPRAAPPAHPSPPPPLPPPVPAGAIFPASSDMPPPPRPVDTCHHALMECSHPDMVSLRQATFRSWADFILSLLPAASEPEGNDPDIDFDLDPLTHEHSYPDLDPDALASSLLELFASDSSAILIPDSLRVFLLSPEGPFQGLLSPRAFSKLVARSQPILATGLHKLWLTRQRLLRVARWDNASRWAAAQASDRPRRVPRTPSTTAATTHSPSPTALTLQGIG